MIRMRKITSLSAVCFTALMLISCGSGQLSQETGGGDPEPSLPAIPSDVTGGKPWIDSCVVGNVTASTETSPAEDFYTYVNKDWIVSAQIPEGSESLDFDNFAEGRAKVLEALAGDDLLDHDAHQAQLLFRAFVNTDARNDAGCEPAKQVIQDIQSLSGIDELNAFLLDINRSAGVPTFIKVSNRKDYSEHRWTTRVGLSDATFGSTMGTMGMDAETVDPDSSVYQTRLALVKHILTRAGYTGEEAEAAFERRLALEKEIIRITKEMRDEEDGSLVLSIDQLDSCVTNFPLSALARERGYGQAEKFEVRNAAEVKAADGLYTEEHLDDLKAYLICGYALEAAGWLDSKAFDAWRADYDANGYHVSLTMPERNNSIEETAVNLAAEITPTLVGRAYTEAYDLAHIKEFVQSLCSEAVEAHKEVVNASTWLSLTSKEKLTEKLDAITMNVVYPDVWEDYSGLDLEGLDYYKARKAIWLDNIARNASYTGREIDDRLWALPSLIEGGGAYDAFTNSFHVDASVVEGAAARYEAGEITLEELLGGTTGYIIFHEIGHALDTGNIYLDARGEAIETSLLTSADLEEYVKRAERVKSYFDGISIWEGQQVYGEVCMNEALAEICGMQARLAYIAKQENFDYRTFFEARAQQVCTLHTPEYELECIMGLDAHPSSYLDVNVTVQQYDEFLKAYGVKEDDKMYLAPEERLVIW